MLDARTELGFAAAHVPGALFCGLEEIPRFAGWFLPYDLPILLVAEPAGLPQAVRYLVRLGYDDLAGYLAGGMLAWHTAGLESVALRTITPHELCRRLGAGEKIGILDVRSDGEVEADRMAGAQHVPLTQLPARLDEVPRDRSVAIFCRSGVRATVAASLLERAGHQGVTVVLGGRSGWKAISCPTRL